MDGSTSAMEGIELALYDPSPPPPLPANDRRGDCHAREDDGHDDEEATFSSSPTFVSADGQDDFSFSGSDAPSSAKSRSRLSGKKKPIMCALASIAAVTIGLGLAVVAFPRKNKPVTSNAALAAYDVDDEGKTLVVDAKSSNGEGTTHREWPAHPTSDLSPEMKMKATEWKDDGWTGDNWNSPAKPSEHSNWKDDGWTAPKQDVEGKPASWGDDGWTGDSWSKTSEDHVEVWGKPASWGGDGWVEEEKEEEWVAPATKPAWPKPEPCVWWSSSSSSSSSSSKSGKGSKSKGSKSLWRRELGSKVSKSGKSSKSSKSSSSSSSGSWDWVKCSHEHWSGDGWTRRQ